MLNIATSRLEIRHIRRICLNIIHLAPIENTGIRDLDITITCSDRALTCISPIIHQITIIVSILTNTGTQGIQLKRRSIYK